MLLTRQLGQTVRLLRTQAVTLPPKTASPDLLTPEHRAWRATVLARAGYRCQWVEGGFRCRKAAPQHRMFADHRIERSDGGALLDPENAQCLCGAHHGVKTMKARAARR